MAFTEPAKWDVDFELFGIIKYLHPPPIEKGDIMRTLDQIGPV